MTGYPLENLFREVAYIAYHFHWPQDQIMNMEHGTGRADATAISINWQAPPVTLQT